MQAFPFKKTVTVEHLGVTKSGDIVVTDTFEDKDAPTHKYMIALMIDGKRFYAITLTDGEEFSLLSYLDRTEDEMKFHLYRIINDELYGKCIRAMERREKVFASVEEEMIKLGFKGAPPQNITRYFGKKGRSNK